MLRRPPRSTRTYPPFPYTTFCRSWNDLVRDLVPIDRAAVGAPAPGAEVDLVDRDRGAGGLTVAARGHPVGVAPAPLRQAVHHRGLGRRCLVGKAERVGPGRQQLSAGAEQLELVDRKSTRLNSSH